MRLSPSRGARAVRCKNLYSGALVLGALMVAAPARAQCGPTMLDWPTTRDSLRVDAAWLAAHLRDPDVMVLQADHSRAEYDAGHIPGARFASLMGFVAGDMDLVSADRLQAAVEALGITNTTRVVVYGDPWHLGFVLLALDVLGHGNRTAILDGGLVAWRAAGQPVTTEAPAAAVRSHYTPHLRTDIVVSADWIAERLKDRRVVVLDVRGQDEYEGTDNTTLPRRGHVPGARHLDWERTFTNPAGLEQGTPSPLVPVAELRRLFNAAGARPGTTPVLYCTIGLRASHMYFVARYLGLSPKFYDGSMSDWTRRPSLPLVTGPAPGGDR